MEETVKKRGRPRKDETEKRGRGRPRTQLDEEEFTKLCQMQCTMKEICGWFDIDEHTLINWCKRTYGKPFSQVFEEKREGGKASLRRMQWNMANKNVAMSIFLGKNYLGQSDDPERAKHELATEDSLAKYINALTDAMKTGDD